MMPHGTRLGLRALSVYGGQTHGFPMGWKAPLCSFSTTSLLSGLRLIDCSKSLAQLPWHPNHWYVVRQNSFLTSGVFAVDATALFFATVRWRGIATLLGVTLSGPLLRL